MIYLSLKIFFFLIVFKLSKKLKSANGGSKKKISNFSLISLFKKFSTREFKTFDLLVIESFIKLLLRISIALMSFSTKVILSAPLEIASIPNDPIPEYF